MTARTYSPKLMLGVLLILFTPLCFSCDSGPRRVSVSEAASLSVSPDELLSDYLKNEVASDAKYKDKVITVTGTIHSIKHAGSRPVVNLLAGNGRGVIQFYLSEDASAAVAKLERGQQTTIKGRCSGFYEDTVLVEDAILR